MFFSRGKTGFFFYKQGKKKKNPKRTNKNNKKNPKTPKKELFSYQSKFSVFSVLSQKPFFDNLAQNARTLQNTIKIGASENTFSKKNCYASRNGHFWTQKTQIQKFQLSFFFCHVFLLFQQKCSETLFYSV